MTNRTLATLLLLGLLLSVAQAQQPAWQRGLVADASIAGGIGFDPSKEPDPLWRQAKIIMLERWQKQTDDYQGGETFNDYMKAWDEYGLNKQSRRLDLLIHHKVITKQAQLEAIQEDYYQYTTLDSFVFGAGSAKRLSRGEARALVASFKLNVDPQLAAELEGLLVQEKWRSSELISAISMMVGARRAYYARKIEKELKYGG